MADRTMTPGERTNWALWEWNNSFYKPSSKILPPMTWDEIKAAKAWLRKHNYPIPSDCPAETCPKYRPACRLGIYHIAVGMCGDL